MAASARWEKFLKNRIFKTHNIWNCHNCNPEGYTDPKKKPALYAKFLKYEKERKKNPFNYIEYPEGLDEVQFPPDWWTPGCDNYPIGDTTCCGLSEIQDGAWMEPGCLELLLSHKGTSGAVIGTAVTKGGEKSQVRYARTLKRLGFTPVGKSWNVNHPTHEITTFYKATIPVKRGQKRMPKEKEQ